MGYNKDVYEAAIRTLEFRRQDAQNDCKLRQNTFYMQYPRAKEIKRLLSSTAIKAAKAVLNGSDTKEQLMILKNQNLKLQKELSDLLKSCGLPRDYLDIKYKCPKCDDRGYIDGKICLCMKDILRKEAYARLNKLSPFSLCSFDSFSLDYYSNGPLNGGHVSARKRMNDILNYCKKYADNFSLSSPNLFMQGATGLGKTHLSLAIARAAIDKGYGVIYGSTQNIVTRLEKERFRYSKGNENFDSEQYLIECDLLILDDLGTEFSTSFSSALIYNVINSRMMAEKPTIISTNLSLKEIEKNYSERFVSRIMGNNIRLEYLGEDVRQQKRFKNMGKQ